MVKQKEYVTVKRENVMDIWENIIMRFFRLLLLEIIVYKFILITQKLFLIKKDSCDMMNSSI